MRELFTIGEVAKLFNLNIRTLRYYDQIGLLEPEKTDQATGYRYYGTRQFERLNTIKYLRTLDVSLDKIAHFFEGRDIGTMMDLLQEQQRKTRSQIAELKKIERKIENRFRQIEDAVSIALNHITEKICQKRAILLLRKEISVKDDLEYSIRELERRNNLEPLMFLGKVGVSVSKENLLANKFEKFSGIFVILEKGDSLNQNVEFLSEGLYVSIRFSGTHRESKHYYEKLLYYIKSKPYEIAGDSIEITLIDAGLTNDPDKYVTELQIPVKST